MVTKKVFFCRFLIACAVVLLLTPSYLNAQQINLPGSQPKVKKAPTKSYKPAAGPVKTYKQHEVSINVNISAKVILIVEVDGKRLTSDFIVSASEAGSYQSHSIYSGDATLELKLPNGSSYRYTQYLSIDPDIATMEISLINGYEIIVNTKTNSQIKEEKRIREKDAANAIVSTLSASVASLHDSRVDSDNFIQALNRLKENNFIDAKAQKQGVILVNSLVSLQQTYSQVKIKASAAEFYRSNDNYIFISNARADFKTVRQHITQMENLWREYSYSTFFITRITDYLNAVETALGYFPPNKEAFSKKVSETNANWERIKAAEEKQRFEEAQRLELERQARVKKEQEAAAIAERERKSRELKWEIERKRNGIFIGGSLPLGIEMGVLDSRYLGNMFGIRYFSSNDFKKVQVHNCMSFPIDGSFQGGLTVGFGAQQTNEKYIDSYYDSEIAIWDYGMSFGGRFMYVDQRIMLGLEATFGSEAAKGIFFIGGFKIGNFY
jgi:hypothetical protein